MQKHQARSQLITVQILGFIALIALVWVDDIFDLPGLFGTTIESVVFIQTIIVTLLSLALGAWLIVHTHRVLHRLQMLEGMLPVCAFCKKIRVDNKWVPIERYIQDHSAAEFTHTFCPECAQANYGEYLKKP